MVDTSHLLRKPHHLPQAQVLRCVRRWGAEAAPCGQPIRLYLPSLAGALAEFKGRLQALQQSGAWGVGGLGSGVGV